MTPGPPTLFTLFGDFTAAWPASAVGPETGVVVGGNPVAVLTWLAALNNSVRVANVRTGVGDVQPTHARTDAGEVRVAVQAELSVDPAVGFLGYTTGWPFVIMSMPDVEFRIQPFTDATHAVNLFASAGDDGIELVLEGVPVEIRLPAGLLEPHPDLPGGPDGSLTVDTGDFQAGRVDDLRVVLRRGDVTSIFVHVRIAMTPTYEFDVQPAVPLSVGKCSLSGIPCVALHDFRLLPSPTVALDTIEWLRHHVDPWIPSLTGASDGLFSVRSVDVDEQADGLQDALQWFNHRDIPGVTAPDVVLGDLVVPFDGPLPVPRHITVGIRRTVLNPTDAGQVYAFDHAPVYLQLSQDPKLHFVLETLYYQSQPGDSAAGPPSGLASGVKSGTYSDGLGLTFTAELVIGDDMSPQQAIELGLQDDYTLVAGYKRAFSSNPNGLPTPNPGAQGTLDAMLHFVLAGAVVLDVIAIRAGFSFGSKFVAQQSFLDSTLATVDLFVSMPPTGEGDSLFRLRTLDGERVAFALENVGWRLGSWHFEGLALPDGVVAYVWDFGLLIYEIGLSAEDGATYISFSGGIVVKVPKSLTGGVTVRRLRVRASGNQNAALIKVDGFFLLFRSGDGSLRIDAGGYYSDTTTDGTTVRELGLSGTVGFKLGMDSFTIGLDLLIGKSISAAETFSYFMAQAFYKGTFAAPAGFELIGARLLYARDMVPALEPYDGQSRDLRYYKWYTESNNPLTVAGDRRLAGWTAEDGAWTFGVGASASFPAFGKIVDLTVFVLGVDSSDETGLLVVGEVRLFSNPRALGYLAVEIDRTQDRTSILVGVDARASSFVKSAPAWMDNVGKFTGTLYISSSPGTVAIGHLADQTTWLTARFDVDLWVANTSLVVAICFEYVDGGPKGFGITARVEGGIGKRGVIQLTYNAGWSLSIMTLTTSSSDYAAVISITAGIHFELFGFLRIGVSAEIGFRMVGIHPASGELTAEVRLDTPWFLPDVTWRLDSTFGQLAPGDLSSAVPPLRSGGATEPAANRQLSTHIERFDPSWDGQGTAPLHSVNELTAPAVPEAQRLANVDADATIEPVAIDATISVLWSVAVEDRLGLGSGIPAGLGDQQAGDLSLSYELIGIAVRRRPRFGTDPAWQTLDQKLELQPDYGSGAGPQLSGAFGPQILNKTWDLDIQIASGPAAKKLLLNGVAPYEFTTANPEVDEQLARTTPNWPCCRRVSDKDLYKLFHNLDWFSAPPGEALDAPAAWSFTDSSSRLRFLRAAWSRPAAYAGFTDSTIIATAGSSLPGVVARADFDEDVAFVRATLAWSPAARLSLVALDSSGREVGRRDLGPGTSAYQTTMFGGSGPIRRLELRAYVMTAAGFTVAASGTLLELAAAAYVGLRDYLNLLIAEKACDGGMPGGSGAFDGAGKLSFLPNHEYEVKLTTRVTIGHPSTPSTAAEVDEFVYFKTKGLPGLNAVARTGDELEPYVLGAYAGGLPGIVYREEPVTLAFSEGFQVAVPLAARTSTGAAEQATLLELQLLVEPELAPNTGTTVTTTDDDWIVTHRGTAPPPTVDTLAWRGVRSLGHSGSTAIVSTDPLRLRLAATTQRPGATCTSADPTQVSGTVLVAPPQGGGPDPNASQPGSTELWAAGAGFSAAVRVQRAGFVDRRPFADGDETALTVRGEGASATWTATGGVLQVSGCGLSVAQFGDPDWDHLTITAGFAPGARRAGIGFALPATGISGALFAVVAAGEGGAAGQLLICSGDVSGQLETLASSPLPEPSTGAGANGSGTPAAPITLVATLFDDRLIAVVGDTVVEVDRAGAPAGPAALVADGPAAFNSLEVHGLDLYAFPFTVSRFRSFADLVGSWSGTLEAAGADALGTGTSTETVATLWAATSATIAAAMTASATSADRDRLFSQWVAGLGLPLADDLTVLELARIVDADGTSALLIESPEPLDFTEEITVTLTRQVQHPPPWPGGLPVGSHAVAPIATDTLVQVSSIRDRLQTLALSPIATGIGVVTPGGAALPPPGKVILDVTPAGADLELQLSPALAGAGRLAVIAVESTGPMLYAGIVRPGLFAGATAILLAEPIGRLEGLPAGSELGAVLASTTTGTVFLTTSDLMHLLGTWQPIGPTTVTIPVSVLQSGDGRRAIIVPLSGTQPTTLASARYRMALALVRKRWQTTDPVDSLNTYESSATIIIDL